MRFLKKVIIKILSFRLKKISVNSIPFSNKNVIDYHLNIDESESSYGEPIVYDKSSGLFRDKYVPFFSYREEVFLELDGTRNLKFSGNHITNSLNFFYESNVGYIPALKSTIRKHKRYSGSCAYISNTEPGHFGHFIMFILPLLEIYRRRKVEPDYYYIGDIELKSFHFQIFEMLGIKKEQVINHPSSFDRIFYAQIENWKVGAIKNYLDEISFNFIKDTLSSGLSLHYSTNYPEKIFLMRGDVKWRKLINEVEIKKALVKNGYRPIVMDGLSLFEQAMYFYNANEIVAVHGAALTNIIYSNTSCKILEILPYAYPDTTSFVLATYAKSLYIAYESEEYDLNTPSCYRDIKVDCSDLLHKMHLNGFEVDL